MMYSTVNERFSEKYDMATMEGQQKRLKTFIQYLGMPVYKFEQTCGLAKGYVSAMRKGIGQQALKRISEHYSELNPVWLITGSGEMITGRNVQTITGDGNHHNSNGTDGGAVELLKNEIEELKSELKSLRDERKTLLSIIEKLSGK